MDDVQVEILSNNNKRYSIDVDAAHPETVEKYLKETIEKYRQELIDSENMQTK